MKLIARDVAGEMTDVRIQQRHDLRAAAFDRCTIHHCSRNTVVMCTHAVRVPRHLPQMVIQTRHSDALHAQAMTRALEGGRVTYHEVVGPAAGQKIVSESSCMQGSGSTSERSSAANVPFVRRPRRRRAGLILDRCVACASDQPLVGPSELEVDVGLAGK